MGNQVILHKLMLNLSFRDFIIIIVKFGKQERIIGSLLNAQGIPIPILVQT